VEPTVNVFWLPKEGNTAEEYEDAYAHSAADRRFAIADGATESSFADRWAKSLVQNYLTAPPNISPQATGEFQEWVKPLQKQWHAAINWESLPWYAEEKARNGAFATFLGLKFTGDDKDKGSFFSRLFSMFSGGDEVRWNSFAVGDSNLFHIREDMMLKAFPFDKSEQFNSRPLLLSSNPNRNQDVWADVKFAEGDCKANDVFILATDAIAKWFLATCEGGGQPWRQLVSLRNADDFANLVAKLRKQSLIRNDDTTLVIFKWTEKPG
jgi:hypothetical protein